MQISINSILPSNYMQVYQQYFSLHLSDQPSSSFRKILSFRIPVFPPLLASMWLFSFIKKQPPRRENVSFQSKTSVISASAKRDHEPEEASSSFLRAWIYVRRDSIVDALVSFSYKRISSSSLSAENDAYYLQRAEQSFYSLFSRQQLG